MRPRRSTCRISRATTRRKRQRHRYWRGGRVGVVLSDQHAKYGKALGYLEGVEGAVDTASIYYVFDTGGDNHRIIVAIQFDQQKLLVRHVFYAQGVRQMEALMDRQMISDITARYQELVTLVPLRTICTGGDYEKAITILNKLLDAGAADESSPLGDLTRTLAAVIGDYENLHNPAQEVSPAGTLRFLMQQHQLTQSDLPEIGSQGVVSEILRGERELNVRQIEKLARRFQVPAAVFI